MPYFPPAPIYDRSAVAILGDSRPAQIYANPAVALVTNGYHWFNQGNALMGQRVNIAGNFAVSGLRSDQYLAGQYTSQAFSTNAYWLMIWGVVNDISATGAATDYWTTYIKPVVMSWLATGRQVILVTETGSTSFSGTPASVGAVAKYNRQIRQAAREMNGVVLFDLAASIMDPTSTLAFKANVCGDGTHPNLIGGVFVAGQAWAVLGKTLFPSCSSLATTKGEVFANGATQWFPNPMWTTTSGGSSTGAVGTVTGTVPSGFTGIILPSGWALTIGTTAGPVGNDLTLALTSSTADVAKLQFDLTSIGTESPGDVFYGNCQYDVTAGASNFQIASLHLESNRASTTTFVEDLFVGSTNGTFPTSAQTIECRTRDLTIQTGARSWLTGYINIYMAGSGAVTLNVRQMAFWRKPAF